MKLVGFASQILVAGILTSYQIGYIKSIQGFLELGVVLGAFGLNTSTISLVSTTNDPTKKNNIFIMAFGYSLIGGVVIGIIFHFLARMNMVSGITEVNDALVWMATLIPVIILNNLFTVFYQALQEFRLLAKILYWSKILGVVLLIIITYYFGFNGFLKALGVTYVGTLIFFIWKAKVEFSSFWSSYTEIVKHYLIAKYAYLTNVFLVLGNFVGILLINFTGQGEKELGYYSFALVLMVVYDTVRASMLQYSVPVLGGASNGGELRKEQYKSLQIKWLGAIIVFSFIGIMISPVAFDVIFWGKYIDSKAFFQILIVAWFFDSIPLLKIALLESVGNTKINFQVSSVKIILNVVMSYYFLMRFGVIGIVVSRLISNIIGFLMFQLLYVRASKTIFN